MVEASGMKLLQLFRIKHPEGSLDPFGIEAALRQRKAVRQSGGYVATKGRA